MQTTSSRFLRVRIFVNIMQIRERNEEGMGRGSKKTFSFSPRPRFSRFAAHHSALVSSRDVRSIALKTLGKERDCSQSIIYAKLQSSRVRHQYGIFGGKSQTSFTRNATRAGSEEGRLFSQATVLRNTQFSLWCQKKSSDR